MLQRVDDGEVPLDGDGHGDEDGAHAADVAEPEGHGQDAHVQAGVVRGGDGGQAEDAHADRQVQDVKQGQAWKNMKLNKLKTRLFGLSVNFSFPQLLVRIFNAQF